jgi:hypothetical protein
MKHAYGIYRKAVYWKSTGREVGRYYQNIYDIAGLG